MQQRHHPLVQSPKHCTLFCMLPQSRVLLLLTARRWLLVTATLLSGTLQPSYPAMGQHVQVRAFKSVASASSFLTGAVGSRQRFVTGTEEEENSQGLSPACAGRWRSELLTFPGMSLGGGKGGSSKKLPLLKETRCCCQQYVGPLWV